MSTNKYKISIIAEYFAISVADIFNILSKCNIIFKKNRQMISKDEINILLEKITQDNQTDNLLEILNENSKKKYKKNINPEINKCPKKERILNVIKDKKEDLINTNSIDVERSNKKVLRINTRNIDINLDKYDDKIEKLIPNIIDENINLNKEKILKKTDNKKINLLKKRQDEKDKFKKIREILPQKIKQNNNLSKNNKLINTNKIIDKKEILKQELIFRNPIVTIMGHVDHGKTSLLDAIRKSQLIKSEFGGITQHIGAYIIEFNDKKITFLDTPGHEAFTLMRARGASITDIVILVISIDDGLMPQTIEAINHAKDAKVPIIVAINKIDKPHNDNDFNNIIQQLSNNGLVAEEWGGDVIICKISAKNNIGINNLLEMIILLSEMLELKSNPNILANGTVIEASLDKNKGPVATLLIKNGSLHLGDLIVAGSCYGKIKAMLDDNRNKIIVANPSMPVEILGLNKIPEAGDTFNVVNNEKIAKSLVKEKQIKNKEDINKEVSKITLDNLFEHIKENKIIEFKIIIKGDTQGSIEALCNTLNQLIFNNIKIKIIHNAVGSINESDVMLAKTSNAMIIGFNIKVNNNLTPDKLRNVNIKYYNVIYDCIEEVKKTMQGLLTPELEEIIIGHAEIRQVFKLNNNIVAGCYVLNGKITKNGNIKILRNKISVFEKDSILSLRRFKDEMKEVLHGYECGISLKKYNELKVNDIIECSEFQEIKNSD